MKIKKYFSLLYFISFSLFLNLAFADSNTSIQVLSATVKDKPISNAEVIFQKNGKQSVMARTGPLGKISTHVPFDVQDESTILIIKAKGYSTLVVKCPCEGLTYALSETMQQLDGMRVVLTWGNSPDDMDSHLVYGNNHVYFNNKSGDKAWLDVDSRQGYGPETITIGERMSGKNYVYAVHTFYERSGSDYDDYNIKAKAQVYVGRSLVRTYYFKPGKVGTLRYLFGINKFGEIYDMNVVVHGVTGENGVAEVLGKRIVKNKKLRHESASLLGESFTYQSNNAQNAASLIESVPRERIEKAKKLNGKGEAAYHRRDLDLAIKLYQKAIAYNPIYSQAYSNLGLAYQKDNRIAEALWANRKAIILAKGKRKKIVRASSYYNIARIYEEKGKLRSALQNYHWAEKQRSRKAYKKAIKRIKSRLQ